MWSSFDEDGDLPWDPLWEYFLGDDDDSIDDRFPWGRRRREDDEGSFVMDYLGSFESASERKSQRKSLANRNDRRDDSTSASSSSISNFFTQSKPEDKGSSTGVFRPFRRQDQESSKTGDWESSSLGFGPAIFGQTDPELPVKNGDKRQNRKNRQKQTSKASEATVSKQESREDVNASVRSRVQVRSDNKSKEVGGPKASCKPFWRRSKQATKDDGTATIPKEPPVPLNKEKRRGLSMFSRSRQIRKDEEREMAYHQHPKTRIDKIDKRDVRQEQTVDERQVDTYAWKNDFSGGVKDDDASRRSRSPLPVFGKRGAPRPGIDGAIHQSHSPLPLFGKRDGPRPETDEVNKQSRSPLPLFGKRARARPGTESSKATSVTGSINESQNNSFFDWANFDISAISEEQSLKQQKPPRRFFVRDAKIESLDRTNESVGDPSVDSLLSTKFGLGGLLAWVQDLDTDDSSSAVSTVSDAEESSDTSPEDNSKGEHSQRVDKKSQLANDSVNEIRLHHQVQSETEVAPPFSALLAIMEARSEDSPDLKNECHSLIQAAPERQTIRTVDLQGPSEQVVSPSDDYNSRVQALASRNTRKGSVKKRVLRHGCRSAKDLSDEQQELCEATGLPVHELSMKELSEIFPKVRSVSDEHRSVCSSSVLGTSHTFRNNCPAHLQVSPEYFGPQSLYEYEYETGIHMYVSYDNFGRPEWPVMKVDDFGRPERSVMKVVSAQTPGRRSAINGSLGEVMIQVEASTISATDCCIRRGNWWKDPQAALPLTPGVDVVGKLFSIDAESSKRYELSKGDRVISLVKWGGNSRYLSLDPSSLVKVPESIDPAVAVCLAESYLSAFQALHYLQDDDIRYLATALQGQNILMVGRAISNMGRAITQLAFDAGADNVYAFSQPDQHQALTEMEISPLDADTSEWWDSLAGKVDFILSLQGDIRPSLYKLLKPSGHAVVINHTRHDSALRQATPDLRMQDMNTSSRLKKWRQTSSTYAYDIYDEWETDMDLCKLDLVHLIELLKHNLVAPSIFDRIPLSEVEHAQSLVESGNTSGFIVCEPWLVAKARAIRL